MTYLFCVNEEKMNSSVKQNDRLDKHMDLLNSTILQTSLKKLGFITTVDKMLGWGERDGTVVHSHIVSLKQHW